MQDPEKQHMHEYARGGEASLSTHGKEDDPSFTPYDDQDDAPALPRHKTGPAILTGVIGGVVSALFPLAITLANAGLYQEAVREGNNMTVAVASTITGLSCLNSFVAMIIAGLVGFIAGKIAVRRMLAFYAGAIVGALYFILPTFLQYIPGVPGHVMDSTGTSFTIAGIGLDLVVLVIFALLGALLALLGGYVATSKHPYYLARARRTEDE